MRTVLVRFRQILSHNGKLLALDIRGNIWTKDSTAPQGWKKVPAPTIELEDAPPISQIPENLQTGGPLRTVHFNTPLKKGRP